MDPWDVPEPKTLKTLPKTPGRRVMPDASGAPVEVKQATEQPAAKPADNTTPPDLHTLPTEEVLSPFADGLEVITTPPPARERTRSDLSAEETEEAPMGLPHGPATTEEVVDSGEFDPSFLEADPVPEVVREDTPIVVKQRGAAPGIIFGGIAGLLFASLGLVAVFILWGGSGDSTAVPQTPTSVKEPIMTPPPVAQEPVKNNEDSTIVNDVVQEVDLLNDASGTDAADNEPEENAALDAAPSETTTDKPDSSGSAKEDVDEPAAQPDAAEVKEYADDTPANPVDTSVLKKGKRNRQKKEESSSPNQSSEPAKPDPKPTTNDDEPPEESPWGPM